MESNVYGGEITDIIEGGRKIDLGFIALKVLASGGRVNLLRVAP